MEPHRIVAVMSASRGVVCGVWAKVCRSRGAAIKEAREIDALPLIREFGKNGNAKTHYLVTFQIEDVSGAIVDRIDKYGCMSCIGGREEDNNLSLVYKELKARGFSRV